ncbi:MAG: F0F1 ATP synthase subunit B [Muribaculaceae bacterium]|nr:F0F1 ATP synthase subunit B [Bacteroidales bacterium]
MELFTPDFGLVFWMFVGFAILFLILWKFAWPVIIKSVDNRAALIDKGVEYAQNAKLQLDNAQQEHDKIVGEARTKQADILREADRLKTQIVEEARNEAKTAAQKEMEAARQSIAQQQKQAEIQLRQQLGQLVLDVAGRVVRTNVDNSEAQSKLVNTYLDEIENGGKGNTPDTEKK